MPLLQNMAAITTQPILKEEAARLQAVYDPLCNEGASMIRTSPGNVTLPASYEKFKDQYKTWKVRPDDVYVLTSPKGGTTWTQELVWLVHNDCNFEKATSAPLDQRSIFMEFPLLVDKFRKVTDKFPASMKGDLFQMMDNMPSPRFLRSHLHFCLLPDDLLDKSKVVMCLRNPKDTVVSFYHHEKLIKCHGYVGDFPTYFDFFMDNLLMYCSYFDYVKEAWTKRNHPNVCLLFFEDMKKDLVTNVRKVSKFLGKELTNENVEALVDHLSFKKMKDNPAVNKEDAKTAKLFNEEGAFIRKGEVGDWKNYFTDEMNKRMDEAIEKHLKPIGLEFRYE